jgi:hypothetical protein
MDTGQTTNLAVAVALLLPALPAGWKASNLRGDIGARWSERVNIVHAGLHERAVEELTRLQVATEEMLGGAAGAFSPVAVWADPAPIVERANRCAEILRTREKLHSWLRRHRRNGSLLIPIVATYVIGWAAVTLVVVKPVSWHWTHWRWIKTAGLSMGAASIVAALLVYAAYTYYESKLASAEESASGAV